jgi:hypothetical protein
MVVPRRRMYEQKCVYIYILNRPWPFYPRAAKTIEMLVKEVAKGVATNYEKVTKFTFWRLKPQTTKTMIKQGRAPQVRIARKFVSPDTNM